MAVKAPRRARPSVHLFATTVRGLEEVATEEVRELTGSAATVRYPGMIQVETEEPAVADLTYLALSLHHVLVVLREGPAETLEDVEALARAVPFEAHVEPDRAFAVRARRRGDHGFGSPDVEERVGQIAVDRVREVAGESLHVRDYRVCDHLAPLKPTLAYGLVRLSGFSAANPCSTRCAAAGPDRGGALGPG